MARGKARVQRSLQSMLEKSAGELIKNKDAWKTIVPERIWVAMIKEGRNWREALRIAFHIMGIAHKAGCKDGDRWSELQKMDQYVWRHIEKTMGHKEWHRFAKATEWLWHDLDEGNRTEVFGAATLDKGEREGGLRRAAKLVRLKDGRDRAILLTVPLTNLLMTDRLKTTMDEPVWEEWERLVDGEGDWKMTAARTRSMALTITEGQSEGELAWTTKFWTEAQKIGRCEWQQTEVMLTF